MKRRFSGLLKPSRSPIYKTLTGADLAYFSSVCPVQLSNLSQYNTDYIGIYKGSSTLMLKPNDVFSISKVIKYCAAEKLAICVQSGNTGLVGGSVPVHDEVILNLSGLSKILEIDEDLDTVRVQAGVILQKLSAACEDKSYTMPLDLGAKGSCMIGGNAATNAGGNRLIRYKSLKENIKELTVVTGKGDIIICKNPLMQVFIGSEGTLGVISEVLLKLPKKNRNSNLALLTCETFQDILQTLQMAQRHLGETLSAFEFLDTESYEMTSNYIPSFSPFFSQISPFYVLVETQGTCQRHDIEKLEYFLQEVLGNTVRDGVIATGVKQFNAIWNLRENCGPAASRKGFCLKYDISTPMSDYYKIVEKVRTEVADKGLTIGFGHVADGNVHINIAVSRSSDLLAVKEKVEKFLYKELKKIGGSISAEHGIGLQKVENLKNFRSLSELQTMVTPP